jgi:hypothetical protein
VRKLCICLAMLAIVSLGLIQIACSEAEAVDLVGGIEPASTAFGGNIHGYAQELARLPADQRKEYLDRARPRLEEGVVYFLRDMGRIRAGERAERVEMFFGTVEGTQATDRSGKVHRGYFKDELVARVHLSGGRTEDALVRCLNMWLELPEHIEKLQPLRDTRFNELQEFTIGRGEGLVHHVDYAVAMDLASRHNLPLYRGRVQDQRFQITVEQARGLESRTDFEQVTVGVVEGDRFDLANGTWRRSNRRIR